MSDIKPRFPFRLVFCWSHNHLPLVSPESGGKANRYLACRARETPENEITSAANEGGSVKSFNVAKNNPWTSASTSACWLFSQTPNVTNRGPLLLQIAIVLIEYSDDIWPTTWLDYWEIEGWRIPTILEPDSSLCIEDVFRTDTTKMYNVAKKLR